MALKLLQTLVLAALPPVSLGLARFRSCPLEWPLPAGWPSRRADLPRTAFGARHAPHWQGASRIARPGASSYTTCGLAPGGDRHPGRKRRPFGPAVSADRRRVSHARAITGWSGALSADEASGFGQWRNATPNNGAPCSADGAKLGTRLRGSGTLDGNHSPRHVAECRAKHRDSRIAGHPVDLPGDTCRGTCAGP